jgi:hypothetical protein
MSGKVNSKLYQWNFTIDGLIPRQVHLKKKVWLKKGELLLEKKGDNLIAYLLGDDNKTTDNENKIIPYLWVSCLITPNSPDLTCGGGRSISSESELGKKPLFSCSITTSIPNEAVDGIEKYAHKFLGFIGKLHDKYIDIVNQNKFLAVALEYFHEANKKSIHSDEGFVNAMISMEALFNDAPIDIKYKLAQRASFLLSFCGIDPIESFEKLKSFYNKRSTLVHGGGSLSYDPDRSLISRYTRKAIIILLILLRDQKRRNQKSADRKKYILQELDYALLDEKRRKSLKMEITKGLRNFNLTIPRTFEGTGKDGKDYRVTAW